jgi:hypothetical protein
MREESAVEPTRSENIRDLAALGGVLGSGVGCRRRVGWQGFRGRLSAQDSDGVEQQTAVPDLIDAKILQVLGRQSWQEPLADRVLAECRLILFEAKAPQPTSSWRSHDWSSSVLTRQ